MNDLCLLALQREQCTICQASKTGIPGEVFIYLFSTMWKCFIPSTSSVLAGQPCGNLTPYNGASPFFYSVKDLVILYIMPNGSAI